MCLSWIRKCLSSNSLKDALGEDDKRIPYRVLSQADVEAERQSYAPEVWHLCHDFCLGWFWKNMRSGRRIYADDADRFLGAGSFPVSSEDWQSLEALDAQLKPLLQAEWEAWHAAHKDDPPIRFDRISIPRFKQRSLLKQRSLRD